jgi:hypothetical protein
MVIEIQENNRIILDHVNNYPIANVATKHPGKIVTERLADGWIITNLDKLTVDTIPQNMIFFW